MYRCKPLVSQLLNQPQINQSDGQFLDSWVESQLVSQLMSHKSFSQLVNPLDSRVSYLVNQPAN